MKHLLNSLFCIFLISLFLSAASRAGDWEGVMLPKLVLKDATAKQALDQFLVLAEEAGAYSHGFKGFVYGEDLGDLNISMDLHDVSMIQALSYLFESGKLRYRIYDHIVCINSFMVDSLIMELDGNVRKAFALPEKGPVKIEELVSALTKRKAWVDGVASRVVIKDYAIIETCTADGDYLRALYEVAKNGLVIAEARTEIPPGAPK